MTTYFITRHAGAVEWARNRGVQVDEHIAHLTADKIATLKGGDIVIGVLPINIVAQINGLGVDYVHLSLEIPPHLRGVELTATQMDECNATLERYRVTTV